MAGNNRGAALLEVVVALAVLAIAGTAAAASAAESARALERVRARDRELRRADAFVNAVALWSRRDLELRLGDHRQGPWRLNLQRPARELFVLALRDSSGAELLRTALFRPDTLHAQP